MNLSGRAERLAEVDQASMPSADVAVVVEAAAATAAVGGSWSLSCGEVRSTGTPARSADAIVSAETASGRGARLRGRRRACAS